MILHGKGRRKSSRQAGKAKEPTLLQIAHRDSLAFHKQFKAVLKASNYQFRPKAV
jgi:hypothetical protein